jgi:hypothetical protein
MTIEQARAIVMKQAGFEEQSKKYYGDDPVTRAAVNDAYKLAYPGVMQIGDDFNNV